MERAEATSGPNSILFGLGSAGGTVSLTGKRAQLHRNRTTAKAQFGSWDFQRYELDANRIIIPKKLSLRLLGLYQDAEGWRKWTVNEQRRITGAVIYQPWRNATLRASYEKDDSANSTAISLNAIDQISAWNAAGRPTADGAAVAGTIRLNENNNRFTFLDQDSAMTNLRGELQTTSTFPTATLVTPDVVPYQYNLAGPGGLRTQYFDTVSLQAERRLTKSLVVELAYFHNKANIRADGTNGSTVEIRGDPNPTLPNPTGATGTVVNPRARELFIEASWFRDKLVTSNDVYRLSLAWETNLGKWLGRHRLAGLTERSEQDRLRRWKNQILVDQANVPISNVASPEKAVNQVTRRRYFAEGDFNNYFAGDPRVTVPEFTFNGRTFHTNYASKVKTNANTEKLPQ